MERDGKKLDSYKALSKVRTVRDLRDPGSRKKKAVKKTAPSKRKLGAVIIC